MKSKKKLVKEYIQKIISKLCYEYGTSLEDARKAVEELDLLNRYKGNYDFVLYQNVSTWVNLIVDRHKKEVERENLKNKTTVKPLTKKYVDEKVEKALKEFRPNRMDVQTYNKVFLPQWRTASLFIRNLQLTLEGKCDKESLRQLQIIGWNEETKKFISDVLNLYKENVLNELNNNNLLESKNTDSKEKANKTVDKLNELMSSQLRLSKNFWEENNLCCKTLERINNIMDNYIMINGKKIELTEEQLKQLGIEVEEKRNSPFDRVSGSESYYFISAEDNIDITSEAYIEVDQLYFDNANYFNDTDFANQVMLHQQLYRKLLKYAYDHNAEDSEWDEDCVNPHYYICFDNKKGHFVVEENHYCHSQNIYFSSEKVAKQAIEYIIKPFMKEHPEFVW